MRLLRSVRAIASCLGFGNSFGIAVGLLIHTTRTFGLVPRNVVANSGRLTRYSENAPHRTARGRPLYGWLTIRPARSLNTSPYCALD